jgi:hypothetical protein
MPADPPDRRDPDPSYWWLRAVHGIARRRHIEELRLRSSEILCRPFHRILRNCVAERTARAEGRPYVGEFSCSILPDDVFACSAWAIDLSVRSIDKIASSEHLSPEAPASATTAKPSEEEQRSPREHAIDQGKVTFGPSQTVTLEGKTYPVGNERPPADPLTLDDRAVALLTRWLKEPRPKMSKRALAKDLGCHHSSLETCPTFLRLWETSRGQIKHGYRDGTTGQIETADDD